MKLDEVIELHKDVINEYGGSHGIRDKRLLESAVYMPYASFGGEDLYSALGEKAGHLCYSLIKHHPFIDGNKRTAMHSMLVFIHSNRARVFQ